MSTDIEVGATTAGNPGAGPRIELPGRAVFDSGAHPDSWKRIKVIINPRAGKDVPVLRTLEAAFRGRFDWDVSIMHRRGDASRLVGNAIAEGADIVAAYGGGGTVSEVAGALAGGEVPLAILPGGTGNGVARALRIPLELSAAASLLADGCVVRNLDLGRINGHTFLQQADLGFFAAMNRATPRPLKDRFGRWAYALSSVRVRRALDSPMHVALTIDGGEMEIDAVMVRVVNVGAAYLRHRALIPDSRPDDGLLDLIVVPPESGGSLTRLAASVLWGYPDTVLRWKVRSALVRTSPPEPVDLDGNVIESTPARIEVVPGALRVIVPGAAYPSWSGDLSR